MITVKAKAKKNGQKLELRRWGNKEEKKSTYLKVSAGTKDPNPLI